MKRYWHFVLSVRWPHYNLKYIDLYSCKSIHIMLINNKFKVKNCGYIVIVFICSGKIGSESNFPACDLFSMHCLIFVICKICTHTVCMYLYRNGKYKHTHTQNSVPLPIITNYYIKLSVYYSELHIFIYVNILPYMCRHNSYNPQTVPYF